MKKEELKELDTLSPRIEEIKGKLQDMYIEVERRYDDLYEQDLEDTPQAEELKGVSGALASAVEGIESTFEAVENILTAYNYS